MIGIGWAVQGIYREPNHVDVDRSPDYKGALDKKRFQYLDESGHRKLEQIFKK